MLAIRINAVQIINVPIIIPPIVFLFLTKNRSYYNCCCNVFGNIH